MILSINCSAVHEVAAFGLLHRQKDTQKHSSMQIVSPLRLHHEQKISMESCRNIQSPVLSIGAKMLASSANRLTLSGGKASVKSLMNNMKRSGPIMLPCDTPELLTISLNMCLCDLRQAISLDT